MKIKNIDFDAEWTKDCQGKWDLDFSVVRVSTRYYPDYTATFSIFVGEKEIYNYKQKTGVYITGETEANCKNRVEEIIKEVLNVLILDKLGEM